MEHKYEHDGHVHIVSVKRSDGDYVVEVDGKSYTVQIEEAAKGMLRFQMDGKQCKTMVSRDKEQRHVFLGGEVYRLNMVHRGAGTAGHEETSGEVISPITGKVILLEVEVGDVVEPGTVLMAVEAMKMEHKLKATVTGVVVKVNTKVGELVDTGTLLISIEASETENETDPEAEGEAKNEAKDEADSGAKDEAMNVTKDEADSGAKDEAMNVTKDEAESKLKEV